MANDPTTCDDDKSMHQQCTTMAVDEALDALDGKRTWICGTQHVLGAEVRRLREYEIRLKLDEAGIDTREKEAIELINLRAEVRRLREELAAPDRRPDIVYERGFKAGRNETVEFNLKRMEAERELFAQRKENDRLREASAVTAVNFGKAQLEIARLQTKLARVEALLEQWERSPSTWGSLAADELEAALHDDPQPAAATKEVTP